MNAFLVILTIIALFISAPVRADETRYSSDAYWQKTWKDFARERSYHHHRKPVVRSWRRVHAPALAPPKPIIPHENSHHCLGDKRALGTPHLTESEALNAAKRSWQAATRYDHGEKYMNIEDAKFVRHRCSRAETNETAIGRAVESVTGGETWRTRCEVVAQPCRRGMTEGDK